MHRPTLLPAEVPVPCNGSRPRESYLRSFLPRNLVARTVLSGIASSLTVARRQQRGILIGRAM